MDSSHLNLTGRVVFKDNVARSLAGGAMALSEYGDAYSIAGSTRVIISGNMCAQGNSAAKGWVGFAHAGGTLIFSTPGAANIANNTPWDIYVSKPESSPQGTLFGGGVVLVAGFQGPWPNGTSYTITGPVAGCAAAFSANVTTTCNACGAGQAWNAQACACEAVSTWCGAGQGWGEGRAGVMESACWWALSCCSTRANTYRLIFNGRVHMCCANMLTNSAGAV